MTGDLTLTDAIEIHARALSRRFGPRATQQARVRARQLAAQGDAQGEIVWLQVAEHAEKMGIQFAPDSAKT